MVAPYGFSLRFPFMTSFHGLLLIVLVMLFSFWFLDSHNKKHKTTPQTGHHGDKLQAGNRKHEPETKIKTGNHNGQPQTGNHKRETINDNG